MSRKKVSNIFNLYKHETIEEFSDTSGNAAKVLIVKLNSDQSRQASEYVDQRITEEKARLESEQKNSIIATYKSLSKDRLINLILSIEEPYITDIVDLSPEEGNAMDKWREDRAKKLSEDTEECLLTYLTDISIESKAKHSAYNDYSRMVLSLSCIDPDSREQLFSMNREDSNYIGHLSQDILNKLTSKRHEIMAAEGKGDVRKVAKDGNFT